MFIVINSIIKKPVKEVFDYILPIDLAYIFKKYKLLPAVISTNEKQKWNIPGLTRLVVFSDRSNAQEELLIVESPNFFSYKITKFSSILRFLIVQINGSWHFQQIKENTHITWKYELIAKNKIAKWIISLFIYKDLQVFLQNAINIIEKDLNQKFQK